MTNNFYPKCLYENRDLAYTSTGHLTPCCWVNTDSDYPYLKNILSDDMIIDNFESIEDILLSEPWRAFFDMLQNNPNDAPSVCKKWCQKGISWEEIEGVEKRIVPND